jgi:2'-5' RNA ligase
MATRRAVIAYANLTDADMTAVQAVRARHDPQFHILAPHFTLVFPMEAHQFDIAGEVESAAKSIAPFRFTLDSVRAAPDPFSGGGHVFLVPEHGAAHINALHARLYSGALSWAHRSDIPYVPHITVGAHPDFHRCEEIAHQVRATHKDMLGWVAALTIVEVGTGNVTPVEVFPLTGAPRIGDTTELTA